jgi:predicted MFS family arabinose efflux permease
VLRAPPWVFLSRYSADTTLPWLSALYFVGLSVGNALSAYFGVALRNQDPRLPFALSSVTLFAVTVGLIWVERTLQARGQRQGAVAANQESPAIGRVDPPLTTPANTAFLFAAALLSLGFQANIAFNAIPQYLRYARPPDLDYLLPLFWVGFNITTFPAAAMTPRWGGARVLVLASALGGLGTLIGAFSPNLVGTMLGQIMVGGGWGAVLMAGLATSLQLGRTGREGAISGLWFSAQSIAAFLRIGVVALQLDRVPNFQDLTTWAAPLLWLGAAAVLAKIAWEARSVRPRLAGHA